jgi:D-alanine-D-alanine ligase
MMRSEVKSWWREFFESPDAFPLSCFPEPDVTVQQVRGIKQLLGLRQDELVADICCGHARHTLPLAADGYQLVGLDISEMMLYVADQLARKMQLQLRLVRGLAQQLPFADGVFDVALNLFNSLGYMDDDDNEAVLSEIARCLKPGGRLLLDTRNKKFQILYAPYREKVTLADGKSALLQCTYDRNNSRLNSVWSNTADPADVYHTASIRLYSPAQIEKLLTGAGFVVNGRYSEYDGTTFQGFERQLIYLCTKR